MQTTRRSDAFECFICQSDTFGAVVMLQMYFSHYCEMNERSLLNISEIFVRVAIVMLKKVQ